MPSGLTPAAIDLLSEVGYQPKYGARPLRRALEQTRYDSAGR